jgi:superfamily II DNA or RNA helicase
VPVNLRPYQNEAIDLINAKLKEKGNGRFLLQLPTGMGKTVIFAHAIAQINRKTLVIAHREELLQQAKSSIERCGVSNIDIVLQSRPNPSANVWVASIQTLVRGDRLEEIMPELIIIDEAHHSVAETYQNVIGMFPHVPVLGFTATPTRTSKKDRKELQRIWGEIIFSYSIRKAILDGWLSQIEYYATESGISLNEVKTVAGDFNQGQLALAVNVSSRNQSAIEEYKKRGGGKAIAFCVNVDHAHAFAHALKQSGVPSKVVVGDTDSEVRRETLAQFNAAPHADNLVLCNCMVLTEGFDCPDVRQVLLLRPTKSPIVYLQALGRGLRIAEGKQACIVIDVVDNCNDPKLCNCLRTAFSLRAGAKMSGNVTELLQQAEKSDKEAKEKADAEESTQEKIAMVLKNLFFDMPEELENSDLAWYSTDESMFACGLGNDKSFIIEESALCLTLYGVSGNQRTLITTSADFAEIDAHALALANRWYTDTAHIWSKERRRNWTKRKATPAQIKHLKKVTKLSEAELANMPRGTASAILSAAFSKADKELATAKQIGYLRYRGIKIEANLTKREATKLIAQQKE